jgi:hypothetical protein
MTPGRRYVISHLSHAAGVAMFVSETFEDSLAGVTLLGRRGLVGFQDLVDDAHKLTEFGSRPRDFLAIAGRLRVGEDRL